MMSTADQIYELVRAMPEEQSRLVLRFAQFVQHQQEEQLHQPSDITMTEAIQSWQQLVAELSGAWPDFPTADELRATLAQDLVREPL
ncbi:MAG: hypothetical protein OHK0047_28730 [Leptolyngbyaceae cyanobacterium]